MQNTAEPKKDIRCRYCNYTFTPEPIISRKGKKNVAYIECPRCGNGSERIARWYDYRKRAVHA